MGFSRRAFLKGLAGGLASVPLTEVLLPRQGWAGFLHPAKTRDAQATTSICPFSRVGCGLVAYTRGGKLVSVQGDPEHPINQGAMCSKGQAVMEVVTSPRRLKKFLYRAPGSDRWEEKDLEWGLTTLAKRIKATRDATFQTVSAAGVPVNRTEALAAIGGSPLNNEECYLITKLSRALGLLFLETQARL